jgi:DNA-binding GntR family transcriptional regulator
MADNAVYDRVFRKIVAKLRQHEVNMAPICSSMLEVQIDNVSQAVAALNTGDFDTAKDLVDELELVLSRFIAEANCTQ